MASSGMLRHMAHVRTDVLEELSASFIRVTTIGELGTTLAVTRKVRTVIYCRTQLLLQTEDIKQSTSFNNPARNLI
jgi:hypothetical protein